MFFSLQPFYCHIYNANCSLLIYWQLSWVAVFPNSCNANISFETSSETLGFKTLWLMSPLGKFETYFTKLEMLACIGLCTCPYRRIFIEQHMCGVSYEYASLASGDWLRYLTASTTCCIGYCLLPGRGKMRECHIYRQLSVWLRCSDYLLSCTSICFLVCPYAKWMFVLGLIIASDQIQ